MESRPQPRAERRRLSHVDRSGRPRMVDVSAKPMTARRAVAEASVAVSPETMSLVIDGGGAKGDVLSVAELAGVMGGEADERADPALPPAAADRHRRGDHPRSRRRRAADPGRGRDDRPDRRRDGGDDGGIGRGAHRLRHGQGRRTRCRDPGRPTRLQDRRQERDVGSAGRAVGRRRLRRHGTRPGRARRRPGRWRQAQGSADDRARCADPRSSSRQATARRPASARTRRARVVGAGSRSSASPSTGRSCRTISAAIEAALRGGASQHDLIVTTGGTGLTPRDVTPQATAAVIDYDVPGIAEAMRAAGRAITPLADLSRGTAGVVGRTLIVNLPGSPKAALESLDADRSRVLRLTPSRRSPGPFTITRRSPRRVDGSAADVRAVRRGPGLSPGLPALLGRGRLLRPRDGPPPADLRRRAAVAGRSRTSRSGSAASIEYAFVQTKMFKDVKAGADARRHLLGLRPPDDRHGQHRDRRGHRGRPVDPVRRRCCGPRSARCRTSSR